MNQSQDWATIKAEKVTQGWVEAAPDVLERRLGTRVEHLGHGPQGLAWTAGELQRQLDSLQQEQKAHPSPDVDRIINELSQTLVKARGELLAASRADTTVTSPSPDCSIAYGANADAYPQSGAQGVAAAASAWFNNDCGYWGDTYAWAYARANFNGTTTTVSQSDGPRSGTSTSSSAYANANGGPSCYSEAYGSAQSTTLGIYYSMSDANSECGWPPVPTISGTSYEYFTLANCRTRTWSSSVSGGTAPFSYEWRRNGSVVGYGSSYTGSVCYYDDGLTLTLTVTDSNSLTGSTSHVVTVDYDACGACGCFGVGDLPICPCLSTGEYICP